MSIIRWLIAPLSFVAICAGLPVFGFFVVNWFDRFCAPEQFIAGSCVATWHASAIDVTIFGITFLLSALVVMVPASIAPAGKKVTSLIAFVLLAAMLGTGSFLISGLPGSMGVGWAVLTAPLIIAAVGGGIGLYFVSSKTLKAA